MNILSDAWKKEISEQIKAEKIAKAMEIGNNRTALLRRLQEAKSCLVDELRKTFGKGTFDFEKKTLTGDNGTVLQWRLRRHPDQPEDYENQQTNVGTVLAYWPGQRILP